MILVLGSEGFIGSYLCNELVKNNIVIGVDRKKENYSVENYKIFYGDFSSIDKMQLPFDEIDCIFHLISDSFFSEGTERVLNDLNEFVIPTIKLLEIMCTKKIKKLIFLSSVGAVYGNDLVTTYCNEKYMNPISSYGLQKRLIETYIQFYGEKYHLDYKIVRFTNVYGINGNKGDRQGIIPIFLERNLLNQSITIYGDGTKRRDFIYINDVIRILTEIANYSGTEHYFNVGSGEIYSINEVISIIEQVTGKSFSNIFYTKERVCDVDEVPPIIGKFRDIINFGECTKIHNAIQEMYKQSIR